VSTEAILTPHWLTVTRCRGRTSYIFGKAQEGTGNLILSRSPSAVNLNHIPFKGKALKLSYSTIFESQKKLCGIFCNKNYCHGKGIIEDFIA
jgi:hypothetical protein